MIHRVLDPYLIAYYAVPIFVFYPLFVAIFGLSRIPIVLIGYLLGVIAIVVNTANGFRNVPEVYQNVGESLQLNSKQTFRHIYLPAAGPYIFTGLKLAFIYSFIGVIASEFILSNSGLGYLVQYNYQNFSTNEMYAVMLLLATVAIIANLVLIRIEDRLYRRSVMS
jgi:NitT/TauT family transport system permease protein